MKMFSECSGKCCVCGNAGGCLAGHGDDHFFPASKERVIDNLNRGKYPYYVDYMVDYLKTRYGYDYKEET